MLLLEVVNLRNLVNSGFVGHVHRLNVFQNDGWIIINDPSEIFILLSEHQSHHHSNAEH